MPKPLLNSLAEFATSIRWANLPDGVREQARLNILDTAGCIASGARLDESLRLLDMEASMGNAGTSSVLGSTRKLSAQAAARVNAYMGDVFELNDLIGGHASIGTITPALALAEQLGASGERLLEAAVTGVEIVCRVHGGFYEHQKPFTETGMAQVGIPNTIGAAAAAARLLDLDTEKTAHAMAIAGALAGWCPAEVIFGDGSEVKPLLFGSWPGSVGLLAAMYARAGMTGAPRLLESPMGYYATVARDIAWEVALDFSHWRLAQPRRKLHACCGYMHSAIDSVAALRREGVKLADASRIRVSIAAYIEPAVSKPAPPQTGNEARFNLQYCLALAALDSDVIVPGHSLDCRRHAGRPELEALRRKFEVVVDPQFGHYRFSRVEVFDAHGQCSQVRNNDAPRGSEWNPMSADEVIDKFRRLAEPLMSTERMNTYVQRLSRLESEQDCGWILGSFDNA